MREGFSDPRLEDATRVGNLSHDRRKPRRMNPRGSYGVSSYPALLVRVRLHHPGAANRSGSAVTSRPATLGADHALRPSSRIRRLFKQFGGTGVPISDCNRGGMAI